MGNKRGMRQLGIMKVIDKWAPILMIAPAAIVLIVIKVYPSLRTMWMSFFDIQLLKDEQPFIGIQNYVKAFSDPMTIKLITNTLVFAVLSLLLGGVLAMVVAIELNKKFPERGFLRALYLAPWITPPMVTATVWTLILNKSVSPINALLLKLNLIDTPISFLSDTQTFLGIFSMPMIIIIIVNVWSIFPFLMIMFLAGLQTIPHELYEAANIDGATGWKVFRYVTFPSLLPVIETSILLQGIWQFNNFNISYLVTKGGPVRLTEVMSVTVYNEAFLKYNYGTSATFSVAMLMVTIIPSIIYLVNNSKREI